MVGRGGLLLPLLGLPPGFAIVSTRSDEVDRAESDDDAQRGEARLLFRWRRSPGWFSILVTPAAVLHREMGRRVGRAGEDKGGGEEGEERKEGGAK